MQAALATRSIEHLPIFKTVTLGKHKTPSQYREAIENAGSRIDNWGNDILGRISCAREEIEVDLVVLSVKELGFNDDASYAHVCSRVALGLCPAEVGPALRLIYKDPPRDEWLHIAMEAIPDLDGDPHIFALSRDLYKWLHGTLADSNDYPTNERFVFVKPR
jgi:hypothetical protein